ncbi:MAG: hypothetical protein MUF64_15300 [Polyangiaceae bacterium]|jgi:hypothetical protein|nr:hypothetical protein [Polyangiaceae bacterium]
MTTPQTRGAIGWFGWLVVLLFKLGMTLLLFATPVLGVWVASSLAAYSRFPLWVPLAVGVLLFPVGPGLWELGSWARRARAARAGAAGRAPILSPSDRFILRSLLLNGVFLGGLLWSRPELAFVAISTRGDWMLEGRTGAEVDAARKAIFSAAQRLEWLYQASHRNPFRDPSPGGSSSASTSAPPPSVLPSGAPAPAPSSAVVPSSSGVLPTKPPAEGPAPSRMFQGGQWPWEGGVHPLVASMPADIEGNIGAMGAHLRQRIDDPVERIRAVHDYVADRIAYDAVSYVEKRYPPQDAESVLKARKGVCAGYALLFEALGKAAGLEVVYVVGDTRSQDGSLAGEGHAWNAVRAGQRWYLVDTTWDSGTVRGREFNKGYRTDYLMTPPEYFGYTHQPEDPRWQLRERPLSRGEFLRQPMLTPTFFAHGLTLVTPERSQVDVQGELTVRLRSARGRFLLLNYSDAAMPRSSDERCEVRQGEEVTALCKFSRPGSYSVSIFSSPDEYGTYSYVGKFHANSR